MVVFQRLRRLLPALAAVAVLVACNPLSLRPDELGDYVARYTGASGAWLEVSYSGTEGFEVRYALVIAITDDGRDCRDADTGAIEPCILWSGLARTGIYTVTGTAYRPAISPRDGDVVHLATLCSRNGEDVTCPTFRVSERVVDETGRLVGNLTDQTGP